MGARLYPQENGGFLQASGLTYHIDASVESSVELNERREFIRVNGSRRVGDVTVGGRPLELDKIYRLASHDYMLKQSGDGFIMFRDCNIVTDEVMIDNQALIRYITERLGGVVGDEYAVSGGSSRIVITGGGVL